MLRAHNPSLAGFRSLTLGDWRQFDRVEIAFHPQLTVLTGENATGKSTLLGILARHFNWMRPYYALPGNQASPDTRRQRVEPTAYGDPIGFLGYNDGTETAIVTPLPVIDATTRTQYDLVLPAQQTVKGVYLTSHRSSPGNYTQVDSIPTNFTSIDQLYNEFDQDTQTAWKSEYTGRTPQRTLKTQLMAAAMFGSVSENNESVEYSEESATVWYGFMDILKLLMPESLRFEHLRVRSPDLLIVTASGTFLWDDASGGLIAIIEMAWKLFLRSRGSGQITVVIDEPENHLHPSLQRNLMPKFIEAFPQAQFIVATHSPFIATARAESAVFALMRPSQAEYAEAQHISGSRSVVARELDYKNKAASADQTLRQVLGLDSTTPLWAEQLFNQIVARHSYVEPTPSTLEELRRELRQSGLESFFPDALSALMDQLSNQSKPEAQ